MYSCSDIELVQLTTIGYSPRRIRPSRQRTRDSEKQEGPGGEMPGPGK